MVLSFLQSKCCLNELLAVDIRPILNLSWLGEGSKSTKFGWPKYCVAVSHGRTVRGIKLVRDLLCRHVSTYGRRFRSHKPSHGSCKDFRIFLSFVGHKLLYIQSSTRVRRLFPHYFNTSHIHKLGRRVATDVVVSLYYPLIFCTFHNTAQC